MRAAKDLPGISVGLVNDDNVFEWEVVLMINDDCKYYGGMSICLSALSLSVSRSPAFPFPSLCSFIPPTPPPHTHTERERESTN